MIASSFVEDQLDERMATYDFENGTGRLMKRYGDVGQEESSVTTILMTLTVLWIGSLVAGILPYRIQVRGKLESGLMFRFQYSHDCIYFHISYVIFNERDWSFSKYQIFENGMIE